MAFPNWETLHSTTSGVSKPFSTCFSVFNSFGDCYAILGGRFLHHMFVSFHFFIKSKGFSSCKEYLWCYYFRTSICTCPNDCQMRTCTSLPHHYYQMHAYCVLSLLVPCAFDTLHISLTCLLWPSSAPLNNQEVKHHCHTHTCHQTDHGPFLETLVVDNLCMGLHMWILTLSHVMTILNSVSFKF